MIYVCLTKLSSVGYCYLTKSIYLKNMLYLEMYVGYLFVLLYLEDFKGCAHWGGGVARYVTERRCAPRV